MPNENVNTSNVFGSQQNQVTSNNKVNNHVKSAEITVKKPQSVSLLQVSQFINFTPFCL